MVPPKRKQRSTRKSSNFEASIFDGIVLHIGFHAYESVCVCMCVCCSNEVEENCQVLLRQVLMTWCVQIGNRGFDCVYACRCVCVCVIQHEASLRVHCNTLHHTAPLCTTRQHTATHCNTATFYNTLRHTACVFACTLHRTASHCTTLQRTATHCNILQHTSTLLHTACVFWSLSR